MTRYAIIGDGAAGTTAAYYVRRMDPNGRIQILCDDPVPAYYRAALTNYLIGELRDEQLFAVPPNFYTEHRVERFLTRVAAVDGRGQVLHLTSGGAPVPYDQLLIAAGSYPNHPPWPGADLAGVMTLRTMQDARVVMDSLGAKQIRRAVIVGAGPLGIEWVHGLRNRGVEVTYVVRGDLFMEGILDRTASDLVWSRLRSAGVDLRLREEIGQVGPGRDGRVGTAVLKNTGGAVECQLVGVAIGIRANTEFLKDSGITMDRGIPVDETMRTNVPNVYAAGDIAAVYDPAMGKHRGFGLWEPARLQGRAAGINMAGGNMPYRVGVQYNATRLWDLDLGATGRSVEQPGDEVKLDFPRTGTGIRYRKLVISGGKLVGALMLGQRQEGVRRRALQLKRVIEIGADVTGVADSLLDPGFDLASWLEAQEALLAPEPIHEVLPVGASSVVPSNSELMRGSHVMASPALPAAPEGEVLEAALIRPDGTRLSLRAVTRLGRAPDNDLVLDDEFVSGHHAEIRQQVSSWMLADTASRNGTFLNDAPVMDPTPLRDGDVIRVGYTKLTAFMPAPRAVASSAFGVQMPSAVPPPALAAVLPPDAVMGYVQRNGSRWDLKGQVVNVGRDPNSDIAVNDPAVSFTHAQITRMGNVLYLRDVGSRNGTYVNYQLVTIPHPLKEGDLIHVGETDLAFHSSIPAGPAPAPAAVPAQTGPGAAASPPPEPLPQPAPTSLAPPHAPGMTPPVAAPPPPPTPVGSAPPAAMPPPAPVAPVAQPPAPAAAPPAPAAPGAQPAPAGPRLTVRAGPLVGLSFALTGSTVGVGRDQTNEVVLRDQTVSRRHARLDARGGGWAVTDLGSTNGTSVGGARLAPNQETPLRPGVEVRFGDVAMAFEG